jgi:hypothetical protein
MGGGDDHGFPSGLAIKKAARVEMYRPSTHNPPFGSMRQRGLMPAHRLLLPACGEKVGMRGPLP